MGRSTFGSSGSINFSRSGIPQPDEHLFFVRAAFGEGIPTVTARAAFNIDFQLGQAATPEPASLMLLAIGIAAARSRTIATCDRANEEVRADYVVVIRMGGTDR